MKLSPAPLALALLVLTLAAVDAQMPVLDPSDPNTPPPGATVITSDELRMDQTTRISIFTGNVIVTGTNFRMTCEEMTVYSTKESKIDNIIAKGNVVILQPGRITHCGQAQYFHDEDKFVLTDQPDILDNKNEIQAPKITIFRTKQSLFTEGRTKTTIIQGMDSSSTNAPPSSNDQK
jgi:lipopolysaccharide export system protein LptA